MNILQTTRHTEVAIVGAGVTGLAIAVNLAERGVGPITIFEQTGIGAGASGVQPGGVRQQWGTEVNCRMARESLAFYSEATDRLDAEVSLRLDRCGYIFLAHSESRLEELSRDVALQNELEISSRILDPSEARRVVPGLAGDDLFGASFLDEDGYFDNAQAVVEAFATMAFRLGATIRRAEIVALHRDGGGWQLEHRDGTFSLATSVVIAAGYDSPALIEPLGVDLPIRKEPRYLFFSRPIRERLVDPLVVSVERRLAIKQLANGSVLASDLSAGEDPNRSPSDWRTHINEVGRSLLPILDFVDYQAPVEGFYDVTPDHQPVLGPVDGADGVWLAAGFSGHGFMMAPAVARCIGSSIAGDPPDPLFDSLLLSRFWRDRLVPELRAF